MPAGWSPSGEKEIRQVAAEHPPGQRVRPPGEVGASRRHWLESMCTRHACETLAIPALEVLHAVENRAAVGADGVAAGQVLSGGCRQHEHAVGAPKTAQPWPGSL